MKEHNVAGQRVLSYDASNPDDLRTLVENGLIWVAAPAAQQAAVNALASGELPLNDRIPADVRAYIERSLTGAADAPTGDMAK